jgi:uncharacterized protein YcsI (UPF0317 family)
MSTPSPAASAAAPCPPVRDALSRTGASGAAVRLACRDGTLDGHTSGLAPGFAQANLVIVPKEYAYDFLLFCTRNPKPCPLLDVTDTGSWEARSVAPGSDLRRDLPRYRVWKNGALAEECTDVTHLWPGSADSADSADSAGHGQHPDARRDWVGFLLGCSFSFEEELLQNGVPVRHLLESKAVAADVQAAGAASDAPVYAPGTDLTQCLAPDAKNVPMYRTAVPCAPAGVFQGPLVVSMRPMRPAQAQAARRITGQYPRVHGAPVHWGDAADLGIADIARPDYGEAVTVYRDEVPVFWACGVTPQAALLEAKIPIAITHAPGHMFVTDVVNVSLQNEMKIDISQRRPAPESAAAAAGPRQLLGRRKAGDTDTAASPAKKARC